MRQRWLVQVALISRPEPRAAAQIGEFGEAGIVQVGLPNWEIRGLLFFCNFCDLAVVQMDVGDVHAVNDGGGEIPHVLTKATIAAD